MHERWTMAGCVALTLAACGPKPVATQPDDVKQVESGGGLDLGSDGTRAVNLLFDAAYSGDPLIRDAALTELMRLAPHVPGTLESLAEGITEGHTDRREACALAFAMYYGKLGKTRDDFDALPALVEALRDEDSSVRIAAARAVGSMGEQAADAVQILAFAMGKDSEQVKLAAVEALGGIGAPAASVAPDLIPLMLSGDPYMGVVAARALGGIASVDVLPQVEQALGHSNADLRLLAVEAVTGYGPAASSAVSTLVAMAGAKTERSDVRVAAIAALGAMGPTSREGSMKPLLAIMEGDDADLAGHAMLALTAMGPEVVPEMVSRATHKNARVRERALDALVRLSVPADQALPVYVKALDDADAAVVFAAVKALGHLGPAAEPALDRLSALMDDLAPGEDYNLLWEEGLDEGTLDPVPETLVEIGPKSVPALLSALAHDMPLVRWRAARALGLIGAASEAAVPALMQAVTDEEVFVRKDAVRALARIGALGAPAVLQALTGPDAFLHVDAVWGLGLVVGEMEGPLELLLQTLAGEDLELRMAAAEALGNAGESGVQPLLAALDGSGPDLRIIVIRSLGLIGPPAREAVERLVNLWGSLDPGDEARALIPWALGHILLPE